MLLKSKFKIKKSKKSPFKFNRFYIFNCLIFAFCLFNFAFADEVPRFYGEEVVVTALRVPRLASAIPWNTKLITRKDIENSPSLNVGDILRDVSGIAIKANGGLGSQIAARLRGATSQQVLVLLNGNRINSPSLGTFDLGDILLEDVEKIEVVKAPLSAIYGADAVGGVINIITRGASEKRKLSVAASYGEYATRNLALSAAGPHYFFSANSVNSDGFRANGDYKSTDLNARLSGNLGKSWLEFGVKKYDAEKGSPGSLDFLTPQARQTDKNLFYDLSWSLENIGFKLNLSQTVLDQKYDNNNPTFPLVSLHKTNSTIFSLQESLDNFPVQHLTLGLEMRKDNSDSSNSGKKEITNQAVYAQDEIDLVGKIKIVLGGRADNNSIYVSHFNPRVGAVLNLREDLLLKISWGTSFKAPTINDLYWTRTAEPGWPTGTITTEGNPNLNPETAQTIDLTLDRSFDRQSSARLSYYSTKIRDMIRWTNISSSTVDQYWKPMNVQSAAIQGVELEYEKEVLDSLKAFVNFNYQSAKDENTNKYLDYSPQSQYNAGLIYYDKNRFNSTVRVKYVGERYTSLDNSVKLVPYTVVDLSLSKDISKLNIKIDIENLFNANYTEAYGYSDIYPMPGRRYKLGVKWEI